MQPKMWIPVITVILYATSVVNIVNGNPFIKSDQKTKQDCKRSSKITPNFAIKLDQGNFDDPQISRDRYSSCYLHCILEKSGAAKTQPALQTLRNVINLPETFDEQDLKHCWEKGHKNSDVCKQSYEFCKCLKESSTKISNDKRNKEEKTDQAVSGGNKTDSAGKTGADKNGDSLGNKNENKNTDSATKQNTDASASEKNDTAGKDDKNTDSAPKGDENKNKSDKNADSAGTISVKADENKNTDSSTKSDKNADSAGTISVKVDENKNTDSSTRSDKNADSTAKADESKNTNSTSAVNLDANQNKESSDKTDINKDDNSTNMNKNADSTGIDKGNQNANSMPTINSEPTKLNTAIKENMKQNSPVEKSSFAEHENNLPNVGENGKLSERTISEEKSTITKTVERKLSSTN